MSTSAHLEKLICDEDAEPNLLLLKVKATQFFMLEDIGYRLEAEFDKYLLPLENGFYRPGEVMPVDPKKLRNLRSNKDSSLYYHEKSTQDVAEAAIAFRRESLLLERPTVPARGIRLMAALFEHELEKIAPYTKTTIGENKILKLLEPGVELHTFISDELLPAAHEDLLDLHRFVSDDVWFLYNTKLYGSSICVEKVEDFRIYDWHLQRYIRRLPPGAEE